MFKFSKKVKENHSELISAAVTYWSDMFTNPSYGDKVNGLDGFGSTLMTFVRVATNCTAEITEEKVSIFKSLLTKYLQEKAKSGFNCTLTTDWAPEYPLSDFIRKAELPNTCFPNKFVMWVNFEEKRVNTNNGEKVYPAVSTI